MVDPALDRPSKIVEIGKDRAKRRRDSRLADAGIAGDQHAAAMRSKEHVVSRAIDAEPDPVTLRPDQAGLFAREPVDDAGAVIGFEPEVGAFCHDRQRVGNCGRAAAALCIKPRRLLTAGQAAKVAALKSASPDFAAIRAVAMRFRGVLLSKDLKRLDKWLDDSQRSGIYAMQRFARTLRHAIQAVRNAVAEPWSNGQTEGQINRLKTLKRAMHGRAGAELLRARMIPLSVFAEHEK